VVLGRDLRARSIKPVERGRRSRRQARGLWGLNGGRKRHKEVPVTHLRKMMLEELQSWISAGVSL
jgi:hypothetical protein